MKENISPHPLFSCVLMSCPAPGTSEIPWLWLGMVSESESLRNLPRSYWWKTSHKNLLEEIFSGEDFFDSLLKPQKCYWLAWGAHVLRASTCLLGASTCSAQRRACDCPLAKNVLDVPSSPAGQRADIQHIWVRLEELGLVFYLCKSALEECFAHMNYLMLTKPLISFRHWPLCYYGLDNFIKFSPSLFISQNGLNYL